jgi:hypothetical protein
MLGLITSSPPVFVVDFYALWYQMHGTLHPTASEIHTMGAAYICMAFILAWVQTLPMWIVSTLIKYYFLQKVCGISANSALASALVTAIIVVLISVIMSKLHARSEGNVAPDELEHVNLELENFTCSDDDERVLNPVSGEA